ncbi:MAG: DHA2 family efflux MFS transporter permease subunit [Azoarcus sp.]|jgi:DHA2 family multidrug resistance protein|nr:DHA2 family efflux MFS transporter permease subunit [Azoarcus sp.]
MNPPPAPATQLPPLEGNARVLVTISLALATFMDVLDTTIANVSIPAIAGDMGVSASQGTWVITSFAVANGISVPLAGWLAQRFGQVRVFVWSTLLFVLTSWLCGLSSSLGMLVLFRVLQGLAAGPMIPLSQSLLLQSYPPAKAGIALAIWLMATAVAPVIGPVLGGWISDNVTWRWIFYINIPTGLAAAGVSWMLLKHRELPTVRLPVDTIGLVLLVIWVGSMQLVLDLGKDRDWFASTEIITLAIIAFVGFCFFLVWELTEKHPIVDLYLFKQRSFALGTLIISVGYGVFYICVIVQPLWMQQYMGYTATWAGLASAPAGLMAVLFMPIVGKVINKADPRLFVSIAFVVMACAFFMRTEFNTLMSFKDMVMPQLIQGIAMAWFFVPISAIIIMGLDPSKLAAAMGLSNFMRITASAFGASVSVTLWEDRAVLHHAQLAESLSPYRSQARMMMEEMQRQGMSQDQVLYSINRMVDVQAATLSAVELFYVSAVIFLGLSVLVWFARPSR